MQRDMDLVRQILIDTEKLDDGKGGWVNLAIDGHDDATVTYHVRLLHGAGLLEAMDMSADGDYEWRPMRLTWTGHEFLDTIRDDTVWRKTKQQAGDRLESVSLSVLTELAGTVAKQMLGLAS